MTEQAKPFIANPAQYRFLQAMKPNSIILFLGGWGIGKSTLFREVACMLAYYNPNVGGLVASHILQHARTTHIPAIISRLKELNLFHSYSKGDRTIYCTNGASIMYGSADRPDTLEGWDVGWGLGDELRFWTPQAHDAFISRVRDKNAAYPFKGFFTTPSMNWMYDTYAHLEDSDDPHEAIIRGSTLENAHNLLDGYVDKLKARMSKAAYDVNVLGLWGIQEGSVFKEFDIETHVIAMEYDGSAPLYAGVDFGVHMPACVFFQHFRYCPTHEVTDCIHVMDELHPDNCPTNVLAVKIKQWERRNSKQIDTLYVDPAGNNRSQETGKPSIRYLEEMGYDVQYTYDKASRNPMLGMEMIRSKLLSAHNVVSLYIHERCKKQERGIVKSLTRTKFRPKASTLSGGDPTKKDEYRHALDAFRYGIINLFPVNPQGVHIH